MDYKYQHKVQKENDVSTRKIILILTVISGIIVSPVFPKEVIKTGTTAAKFLNIGIGPRGIAMGGAFTSLANDASAMYWNPAGVALVDKYQILFTQARWIADVNVNYMGLVVPLGSLGTLGFNVTALTMNDMEVTTEFNPEGTGEKFGAGEYAFGISFARRLYENFSLGVNLKYIRQDISSSSAQGLAIDIGTLFNTPFWGVKFASSITNFGTKMQMDGDDLIIQHDPDTQQGGNNSKLDAKYRTDQFELPLRLQIGVSRDFMVMEGQRLTIAVDAAHPNDNSEFVNAGGELALFQEMVFLRGGYKTLWIRNPEEGLTLGAGFQYSKLNFVELEIDYAFQNYRHLGDIHTFGFLIKF